MNILLRAHSENEASKFRNAKILTFICLCMLMLLLPNMKAEAYTENHTIKTGERLRLSFTTPNAIHTATWRAMDPNVIVESYGVTSCTIVGGAVTVFPVIVRCDYYYWVYSGTYPYLIAGYQDFSITVERSVPKGPSKVLLPSSMNLALGGYRTLTPEVSPAGTPTQFDWGTSNPNMVTVDSNGKVYGKGVGTASVTVETQNGLRAQCNVTVTAPTPTYSITYQTNGGILNNPCISYTFGKGCQLPTPVKAGNSFEGWYTNAQFIGSSVKALSTADKGNKIFWAKWKTQKPTVTSPEPDKSTNRRKLLSKEVEVTLFTNDRWSDSGSFTYTGKAITPKVHLRIKKENYIFGTFSDISLIDLDYYLGYLELDGNDYTVKYTNNINAGTGKIQITGKGKYQGTITKKFKIIPRKIKKCSMSSISRQVYYGKAVKPKPNLRYGNKRLKSGRDYTVSYKNNKGSGSIASITVKGKGNFKGIITRKFKIK